jgi:glycosyltransferase involved in cell wall biosynthesis
MRVAFFYNQERLPPSHPQTNPYGPLLSAALEQRGVEIEFALNLDDRFLQEHRGKIDILHLNWPHYDYYDDDAAVMERQLAVFVHRLETARDLGYKVVWTAHNLYPHNRRHRALDHEGRLALCRLANAVIAHCAAAAEAVKETFGRTERLFVIPHGHFIDVYPDTISREEARARLGIPPDAFAYGFFGSLQPYKGIEALLEDFARLPEDDAWLVISGGGKEDYLETMRRRAADIPRVVLRTFPRAPSEEITLIMRAADVVTLPFVATMTSGTLILALSWGRPVIAPALGCLPETVAPDAGILYDPESPDALHQALRAIRDRDLDAAGRAALDCARRFDWDHIADLTLEAYRA